MKTISVVNPEGRTFNVRLVFKGENRNDYSVHDNDDPLVEFYDATHIPHVPQAGGLGQFVSSYYASTLLERESKPYALNLDGVVDAWWVSKENVDEVISFIRKNVV
jgi:hypothetical protein